MFLREAQFWFSSTFVACFCLRRGFDLLMVQVLQFVLWICARPNLRGFPP